MIENLNEIDNLPSFYSILTANVRYDNRLSFAERVFYSEITCRTNALGYCYTSNCTFAKLYNKDIRTITRWVSHLTELNYIKVELIKDELGQVIQRKIYISELGGIDKNVYRGIDKNAGRGTDKNVLYNNININNNTHTTSLEKVKIKYAEKVYMTESEYLDLKTLYGDSKAKKCIEELNLYKLGTGKEYENDYAMIKRWVINRVNTLDKKETVKNTKYIGRQYTEEEIEQLYANL